MTDTINLDRFDDLAAAQEEGKAFDLLDEKGQPIGLRLTITGPDSTRTRKAQRDTAQEFSKRAEERALAQQPVPDDEDDQRRAALLSRLTTGWAPNPTISGKSIPFTEENARNFFVRFRIFADQIERLASYRVPFVTSSSKGSAS